jgi:hypothetical protein
MTMPKKRLISGMGRLVAKHGKEILRFLARYLEVEGVRAEIDPVVPDEFAGRADPYLFEGAMITPQGEDTFTGQVGKVHRPGNPIVKLQIQDISLQWPDFRDFTHCQFPLFPLIIPWAETSGKASTL